MKYKYVFVGDNQEDADTLVGLLNDGWWILSANSGDSLVHYLLGYEEGEK